jgi:hypothetical protein
MLIPRNALQMGKGKALVWSSLPLKASAKALVEFFSKQAVLNKTIMFIFAP